MKLDILLNGFYRSRLEETEQHVCLQLDASPQKGFQFFCVVEELVSWPSSSSLTDQVNLNLNECVSRRILPLAVLARGRTSAWHKTSTLVFSLKLLAGDGPLWEKLRKSVRGIVSDQGVEQHMAEHANMEPLIVTETLQKLRRGDLSREVFLDGYLFPCCLWTPDHLHMIFGAIKNACEAHPIWPSLHKVLRDFGSFLRNREMRLCNICVCV